MILPLEDLLKQSEANSLFFLKDTSYLYVSKTIHIVNAGA